MKDHMGPVELKEDAGTKYYCTCGRSANFPYCDGAHKETGMNPRAEDVKEARTIWVCACGKSDSMPFCNGAHKLD